MTPELERPIDQSPAHRSLSTRLGELAIGLASSVGFGASVYIVVEQFDVPATVNIPASVISAAVVAAGFMRDRS